MCIIAYKPAGVKFPSDDILKTCFQNNKDGAGFMYPTKDGVRIKKGFMTYEDFDKAIKPLKNSFGLPVVMHFRISTHAGVNPEMTQPFPVTSKTRKLKSTDTISRVGIAHNGIISMTNDAKEISDTALFIKRYASFLIRDVEYYKDKRIPEMIEAMIGSRMAILSTDGHVELLGTGWKTDENGMWFSNDSYKSWKSRYNFKGTYAYGDYDWDDDFTYYSTKYSRTIKPLDFEMTEKEREEWLQWREDCVDNQDTFGYACYGCPYESHCYAV